MDTRVKGDTKLFASIGDPVKHSLSPQIHNSIFSLNNLNNLHMVLKIQEEELEKYLILLRQNFTGLSVTKPHKQNIIKYLDEIDEDADKFKSVNTIKIEDGLLKGYSTDGYGFIKALELHDIDIKDKDILLIGAGGAASVISFEILRLGGNLTITNRTIDKAVELKEDLSKYYDSNKINICKKEDLDCGYFGIINATPIGMYPNIGESPIKEDIIEGTNFVFDLIYNPESTLLLDYSKKYGCKSINGLSMLFYQGVRAQEIWTDIKLDEKVLLDIKEEIEDYIRKVNE